MLFFILVVKPTNTINIVYIHDLLIMEVVEIFNVRKDGLLFSFQGSGACVLTFAERSQIAIDARLYILDVRSLRVDQFRHYTSAIVHILAAIVACYQPTKPPIVARSN